MTDCIFCSIVAKKIPHYAVYEDEKVLAFLDIHPSCKGHTVVISKTHAKTLLELPDEEIQPLFVGVKKTMQRVQEKLQPQGFNVGWNHESAGGQVVPHLHVHVFPRWHDDGGTNVHAVVQKPEHVNLEEIAALFR